jgi:hypothetical protein
VRKNNERKINRTEFMKKTLVTKNNLISIVLVVIYLLVMLRFGLPYPKRELLRGTTYGGVARESQFLRKLYVVRKPFKIAAEIGLPFLFGLMVFQRDLLNLATGFGMIKLSKKMIGSCLIVCCIIALAELSLVVLSLVITSISQSEALREYSRVEFLWSLGIAFAIFVGIDYFLRYFIYFLNIERNQRF